MNNMKTPSSFYSLSMLIWMVIILNVYTTASQPLSANQIDDDSEETYEWLNKEKRPFCNAFAGKICYTLMSLLNQNLETEIRVKCFSPTQPTFETSRGFFQSIRINHFEFSSWLTGCGRKRANLSIRESRNPSSYGKASQNHPGPLNHDASQILDKLYARIQHYRTNTGHLDENDYKWDDLIQQLNW